MRKRARICCIASQGLSFEEEHFVESLPRELGEFLLETVDLAWEGDGAEIRTISTVIDIRRAPATKDVETHE